MYRFLIFSNKLDLNQQTRFTIIVINNSNCHCLTLCVIFAGKVKNFVEELINVGFGLPHLDGSG